MSEVSGVRPKSDIFAACGGSRRPRHTSGQASVEFALVLPALLIITVAVCQVALALNCYLVATAASREGARRGAETNDPEAAREAAGAAASGLPGPKPNIDVSFPDGRARGSAVKVTVTYRMPLLVPGLERLLSQPRFSRSTSMALERDE